VHDCLSQREIATFVEGSASAEQVTAWKRHLRVCDLCAGAVVRARAGLKPVPRTPEKGEAPVQDEAAGGPLVALEPNVRIGDFKLERRLGTGGMGVVYQALQVSLNRRVALKILPLGFGRDAAGIERFHREARAAAKLRHRNIVTVYAEGAENNVCYFAMEMFDGLNLDQAIEDLRAARSGTSKPGDSGAAADRPSHLLRQCESDHEYFPCVARLISEVAEALDYAHDEGVIHRDVKPSNLILARDGRLVLLDFGIARICEERAMTVTESFVGTPRYMSPEQLADGPRKLDHRSDIYSLGVTLYELLTLEPLFQDDTQQQLIGHILTKDPRRPRQVNRNIPGDLDTICCKAIEKDPNRRYQSAGEMADDLRRYLSGRLIQAKPPGVRDLICKFVRRRKVGVVMTSVLVLVSAIAAAVAWKHYTTRWAQQSAMARIDDLIEQKNYCDAFFLAKRAERYIPDDPLLVNRWPQMSRQHTILTDPPGARVFISKYEGQRPEWKYLGRAPIRGVRIPFGTYRWRAQRTGYVSLEVVLSNDLPWPQADLAGLPLRYANFALQKKAHCPSEMVWIPPATLKQELLYHGTRAIDSAPAYLIDKCEVTNSEYKTFVDRGGYENADYWQEPFVRDGKTVPWSEAMAGFRDATGRPGPATWSNGTHAAGREFYPVGGISWYEAVAYARFCGKDLPTIFHWTYAARADDQPYRITRLSNFGDGPAPVASHKGMGRFGLYDAAGNVREWCYNAIEGNESVRCMLGGTWNEYDTAFINGAFRSPWDRDPANGLRCVRYIGGREAVPAPAFEPVEYKYRDFSRFKPVSDEVFKSYIDTWYRYDKTELNARVESVDDELGYCRRERITFDTAYPNDRVIAYLHLPTNAAPPYQIVVWYPSGGSRFGPWDERAYTSELVGIIRSGRAVILPFYKGTYDRMLEKPFYPPEGTQSRNLYVQRSQDLRRSIDYLQRRDDIDTEKLAFVGLSWGGQMASVMIATESRFRTGIFLLAGICACTRHPASDPANFAPRVTIPILMLNGREDSLFPYETAQKPLFELLGTPERHKKHIVFPGEHCLPSEYQGQYHAEIVKWLDQYLGPVNKMADDSKEEAEKDAPILPGRKK